MLEVILICLAVAVGFVVAMRMDVEPRRPAAPPSVTAAPAPAPPHDPAQDRPA